jgi:hypothetical protein
MVKSSAANKQQEAAAGICMAALVPVRKAPGEESEMVSQLLFGEYYFVSEILKKWLKITTVYDNYAGWIDRKFFHEAVVEEIREARMHPVLYSRVSEIGLPDGTLQLIPAGSSLPGYNEANQGFSIGKQNYTIRSLSGELFLPASQKIPETAHVFMNTPYIWGGRSVFGFDCSGFIQSVYKIHGKPLPRDTDHQILAGEPIASLKDSVPGDLAFFCDEEGEVNHVGMVLAGSLIIHCSGWVRVDRLDEKGIFNREKGIYTHLLKEVRRILVDS